MKEYDMQLRNLSTALQLGIISWRQYFEGLNALSWVVVKPFKKAEKAAA